MRKTASTLALAIGFAGLTATGALAQSDNMQKLQQFRTTGTSLDIPTVPQGGKNAAQITKNLESIKLPPGLFLPCTL